VLISYIYNVVSTQVKSFGEDFIALLNKFSYTFLDTNFCKKNAGPDYIIYTAEHTLGYTFLSNTFNNTLLLNCICAFIYWGAKYSYTLYQSYFFGMIFIFFFIFLLDCYESEGDKNLWFKKLCNYIILWLRFIFEKLENFEESYLFLKLASFILFLFFSNLFLWSEYINFIVFIEWNIPVCFGLVLIIELVLLFGSYILLYLNGSKSRKILVASFFEDLMNFFILVVRIFLQFIRGVICGIYHDLLREANLIIIRRLVNLNESWLLLFNNNHSFQNVPLFYIIVFYVFFFFIVTFGVTLMFLQALFLFLAIWLFCKCWFLAVLHSKFLINNKDNLLKYKKYFNVKFLNKSCYLFVGSKCNISKVKLFHIYREGKNCKSKLSFFCRTSVRKLKANRKIDFKKKKKLFSLFVRTKQWILREDGSQRKFFNNTIIILKKNTQLWTNHIWGPTTVELKRKKILTKFKNII